MRNSIITLFLFSAVILCRAQTPASYVNPFIGTNEMGHTYPGATVPFGMVQLSPETDTIQYSIGKGYIKEVYRYCAGYQYSDKTIVGFSHTHFSGTGHSDLGDFLVMPTTGVVQLNPGTAEHPETGYRSRFSHETEKATAGYYSVVLSDYNIKAELTTSERVGFHRYTFPESSQANIILDMVSGIYNYDGKVHWAGLFTQLEYKAGKISTFINLSASVSGFKRIDYFNNKTSDWGYKEGFTIKTGLNYNLSEHSNVFGNVGYLSKTRDFQYIFKYRSSDFSPNAKNEKVQALELGYSYNSKTFSANLNAYYTKWNNKPTNSVSGMYTNPITGTDMYTTGEIPGMDARHTGIEFDFIYKIRTKLDFQGLVSIGDWIWDKKIDNVQMYYTENGEPANKFSFDATGIHVGDAAQTQLGATLRYEILKGLYVEGGGTFFDRYYANFNPEQCTDPQGNPVESWRIPAYATLDMHAGYRFKVKSFDKLSFALKFNVLNVANTTYISDATNNDTYNQINYSTFDARSASVFMGAGRQFTTSLKIIFE